MTHSSSFLVRLGATSALAAVALFASACMSSGGSGTPAGGSGGSGGTGNTSGSGGTAGGGGTSAGQGISCLGILSCVQKNGCADNPCVDACLNQGSADAKNAVTDLATCYQNNGCQDSTCLKSNCATQLDTCVGQSAPPATGTPTSGGSVPAGSVPAWLVGQWAFLDGYDPGSEEAWTFNADGTATYSKAYAGGIADCNNSQLLQYSGNAVVDDTSITLYATDAQSKTDTCGGYTSQTVQPAMISFAYSVDASGKLKTVDQTCAAQYAGYDTSIGLYCTSTFTKQ